jgi:hypothetical protein
MTHGLDSVKLKEMKLRRLWDIRPALFCSGPPLWSSGQSSLLQSHRFRVRFPALPDFMGSVGSGTGSTQKNDELLERKVAASVWKTEINGRRDSLH